MSKVIFVTGGAGYVGSHTVLELLKANYDVIVLDNLSNAVCNDVNQNALPESLERVQKLSGKRLIRFYNSDLLDEKSIDYIFGQHHIEAVIHFAALKAVGESCQIPLSYYRNNLTGTINLLDVMKRHGVKKIVFSSSSTVYGNPQYLPVDELHPVGNNLTNPYGRTKYFVEEIMNDLARSEKSWCVTHLRYFNPIGAHPSGEIGEDPQDVPNNLLPYVAQVAVGRRSHLSVFGNDFNTPDGTGVRDYIHIMDLARGHVMTLNKMLEEGWSGTNVYNLGTGRGYSVLEVVKAFEDASGAKIPYKIVSRRLGDIDANYADAQKAWEKIGWKCEYSLEDMCKHAWIWQSKYPYGYRAGLIHEEKVEESKQKLSTNGTRNGCSNGMAKV